MSILQLDDPENNRGLGWVRLTEKQLADLLYIGVKLARRSQRQDLTHRNATRADAAARAIANDLARRLGRYPVFGPARPADGPTCGGSAAREERGRVSG